MLTVETLLMAAGQSIVAGIVIGLLLKWVITKILN